MSEKQPVEIKFEHLPNRIYTGTIDVIARGQSNFSPEALSNKLGGALPTVTDAQGRERLTSIAYQATVHLTTDVHLIKPGMRGRARWSVGRRSTGEWIWRYVTRTFHFRL